jgi:O-antigen/teichoic acid export membrane protein
MDCRQLLKNVFSNWGIFALSIVINLMMTPLIVSTLGKEYYGIWVIINSLVGYMNILDFGVRPAVIRYISKYIGLGDRKGINNVIVTSLLLLSGVGLLCLVITLLASHFFADIYNVTTLDAALLRKSVLVVGLSFALGMPLQVFGGIVGAYERYDLQNLNRLLFLVVRNAAVLHAMKSGGNIYDLALISSVTTFAQSVVDVIIARTVFGRIAFRGYRYESGLMSEIARYGIWSFIIQVSLQVIYYADVTVVGIYVSTAAVAVYSVAGSLVEYLRQFVGNMTRVFTPVMTKSYFRNSHDDLRTLYVEGTNYSFAISIPLLAGLVFMGDHFIELWLGTGFSQSYGLMLVLLAPQLFGLSQTMSSQVMFGLGRNDFLARLELASAAANLVLSLILVRKFGVMGVALGTAIPLIITHSIILPVMVCRAVEVPLARYLRGAFSRGFMCVLPMSLFLGACRYGLNLRYDWFLFCGVVAAGGVIYLFSVWFLLFDRGLRARIHGRLFSTA